MRHLATTLVTLTSLTTIWSCGPGTQAPDTMDMGPGPNPKQDMMADIAPDVTPDVAPDATCVPTTCEALGANTCGPQPDGCDGMLECGPCGCDPADVEGTCSSQPCQVATGCGADGACEYEPVTCSGLLCACPPGQDCENEPVRCTGACPALACDASPMMVEGQTVYQNLCVDVEPATCKPDGVACGGGTCDANDVCQVNACGVCGLGAWSCEGASPVCESLALGMLNEAMVNCDDTAVGSTFLYVDYINGDSDPTSGSRAQPFSNIQLALAASEARGTKAIVIAGSPRIEDIERWDKALSLYGGFSNDAGVWTRDVTQRPVVSGASMEPGGSSVGLRVTGDASKIVFSGLRIRARAPQGSSGAGSVGLALRGVTDILLHDVDIEAAAPSPGAPGAPGIPGAPGGDGHQALTYNQGVAGTNPTCSMADGGMGGRGAINLGMSGGDGSPSVLGTNGGSGGMTGARGGNGTSGVTPDPAAPGRAGVFAGEVKGYAWLPGGAGEIGVAGDTGPGGGGGGGAGRASRLGDGGAGGAAGGCGGQPGGAGSPGGASIALLLIDVRKVVVQGGSWKAASGGRGGDGGRGGLGGKGGVGGKAAVNTPQRGGDGGDGADGGVGSVGGPGAGGSSYGVLCDNANVELRKSPVITLGLAGEPGRAGDVRAESGEALENKGCM